MVVGDVVVDLKVSEPGGVVVHESKFESASRDEQGRSSREFRPVAVVAHWVCRSPELYS